MRKFQRVDPPEFLQGSFEEWGQAWHDLKMQSPSASFQWRTHEGLKVNIHLLPLLKQQTDAHCSYCDNFPVSPPSLETIDHFKPKSEYHLDAYRWENLYFCCDYCQRRLAEYNDLLLRPDSPVFDFDRFFRWDFEEGKLDPNPLADEQDQLRASETIRVFRLNEEHPLLRRRARHHRVKMPEEPLNDFAYRHFLGN